jgi:ABC-type Zn uptake system ZnuABC Zn-binding protein ZnuA
MSGLPPSGKRVAPIDTPKQIGLGKAARMSRLFSRCISASVLAAVLQLALPPCSIAASAVPTATVPVVTSTSVLADLVENVGGDRIQVRPLAPTGADAHTFQPTPASMTALAKARLVVFNGAGLEGWWNNTFKSSGRRDVPVIELSRGLTTLAPPGGSQKAGESTGEPDPHVWLDPILVQTYVERIRDALTRVDSAGGDEYAVRAKAYQAKLAELDAWIRAEVEAVPPARRKLVTFHDAFQYFARRYGFSVKGFVVASPGKEPSAKSLADLARRIKQEGIPAVFAEADFNPKLLQVLARDAGVKVVTNLYDESLTSGPPAGTYLALMRHNVTTIVRALK